MFHDITGNSTQLPLTPRAQRKAEVLLAVKASPSPVTDREVAELLGYEDMNAVRRRITELVRDGELVECSSVLDIITGRVVRTIKAA